MILHKLPDSRFSQVVREWSGKAVVIGGGPSLTLEQVALVRRAGVPTVAVNDAYLWAYFAEVLYAADSQWWAWHAAGTAKPALHFTAAEVRERYETFAGQRCSIQYSGANITDPRVHILKNKNFPNHGVGLSLDPVALVTGRNSGFQAINLAILAGATTVILLGIDGKLAADGKTHFHGGHPRPTPTDAFYEAMRKSFSAAEDAIKAAGVRVINCSPGSAIDSFEKMSIEVALMDGIVPYEPIPGQPGLIAHPDVIEHLKHLNKL